MGKLEKPQCLDRAESKPICMAPEAGCQAQDYEIAAEDIARMNATTKKPIETTESDSRSCRSLEGS